MAQLDPNRYIRLSSPANYAGSDGLYYDRLEGRLVYALGDTIVGYVTSGGSSVDLEIASEARGDVLRRDASAWGRLSAKTLGYVLQGDGTDLVSALITAANLDPTLVPYKKVVVSSAELLAINATPKVLVAAPGAGFTTIVHRALLVLNYNSAAYANNGILGIYETDASGTLLTGTLTLASFLAQTADTQKELHPTAASATTGLTRGDNKAVVLTQATGESISGDSPVDVHLWYSTVPNGL